MATNSQSERDATLALTGEKVTDATLYGYPVEPEEPENHVSAFQEPSEQPEGQPSSDVEKETNDKRTSIGNPLDLLKTQVKQTIRGPVSVLKGSKRSNKPEWIEAEKGTQYVHHDDAQALQDLLEFIQKNYDDGKLYFRKTHVGDYGEYVNWEMKFAHKSRGYRVEARALKDVAKKVKSYLDFTEAGDLDERFSRLYEMIRNDKRFSRALLLFKEGKGKDYYPWKVRVEHKTNGFTKVSNTLPEAIAAMEDHLTYDEATPNEQQGVIWERVFAALEKYPKCKVFFKSVTEERADGEQDVTWYIKVDQPNRGIQFEATSRILEEAAGQVCDYLEQGNNDNDKDQNSKASQYA